MGFTTGQIQLVYPGRREQGKLYNEEVRLSNFIRKFKSFKLKVFILIILEINRQNQSYMFEVAAEFFKSLPCRARIRSLVFI